MSQLPSGRAPICYIAAWTASIACMCFVLFMLCVQGVQEVNRMMRVRSTTAMSGTDPAGCLVLLQQMATCSLPPVFFWCPTIRIAARWLRGTRPGHLHTDLWHVPFTHRTFRANYTSVTLRRLTILPSRFNSMPASEIRITNRNRGTFQLIRAPLMPDYIQTWYGAISA